MKLTLEESRELLAFVDRHKPDLGGLLVSLAEKSQRQIEYYYLDGEHSLGYDKEFYAEVLSKIAWSLMYDGPMQCDGYNYPDDAPRCMTSKLL